MMKSFVRSLIASAACCSALAVTAQETVPADEPEVAEDVPPLAFAATPTIDVLVVYTAAARAECGGIPSIKAQVGTCVSQANLCFSNSDANLAVRVVGMSEVSYTESASFDTDLSRLRTANDGFLDEVHTLRNSVGADVVVLFRSALNGTVYGRSYQGDGTAGFSTSAFCVLNGRSAATYYYFVRELGHLFGCNHDRATLGDLNLTGHNYGYKFVAGQGIAATFRTVMAVGSERTIPYFSNPSVFYTGVPTGVAIGQPGAADNAQVLETNAPSVENFRPTNTARGSHVRGDFSRDSKIDLVFSNSATGARELWTMNGVQRTGVTRFATVPPVWRIAGTDDFNGDGYSDLVWEQTADGSRVVWYMRDTTMLGTGTFPSAPVEWRICGTGDFNADGRPDLVLENTVNGNHCVWYMNNTQRLGLANLPNVPIAWRLALVCDLTSDEKPDLIWEQTTTGERCAWLMDGLVMSSSRNLPAKGPTWKLVAAGDFNRDQHFDLVLENSADGSHEIWYMSNAQRVSSGSLPSAPSQWTIGNR